MGTPAFESTTCLLAGAQAGDAAALDRLLAHCRPLLQRWARGRLPDVARALVETEDLVQVTLMRAAAQIGSFESRGTGAFLAYLRAAIMNCVREELRRSGRRPTEGLEISVAFDGIGPEDLTAYESALELLPEDARLAVILRLEFGMSYAEVAAELDKPSADAARMLVARALVRLAEAMK